MAVPADADLDDIWVTETPEVTEPPAPGDDRRFAVALGLITLGALALRVGYVLHTRGDAMFSDSWGYHQRALLFADGEPYRMPLDQLIGTGGTPPDAHVPPMWTTVLGSAALLGLRSVLSHQLVTAVVGAVAVGTIGFAGRAAFGRPVGLVAAAVFAVYPNAWVYERELLSEPLSMVGVGLVLLLTYRFLHRPGVGRAVALGVAAGALALTRSEQVLVFPLVVLPAVLIAGGVELRRRAAWGAVALVAGAATLAPWAAFNATRFEQPVILSTGSGSALRAGNCAPAYESDLLGWFSTEGLPGDPDGCSILDGEFDDDPSVADGQLREAALTFMSENRSRVPVAVAARIGRTFNVFRPADQVHREAERGSSVAVVRTGMVAYWLLVPFAVGGTVLARRRGVPVFPLLAFVGIVVVSVSMTIGSVRYRAPAEVPFVILASVAIVHVAGRRRRADGSAAPEPPAVPT